VTARSTGSRTASLLGRAGSLAGAGAAVAVGALAAAHSTTTDFGVRRETLAVLPPGQPELRVLHLSDIHMVPGQDAKTVFLHELASLRPDLVVNTGDNLSHHGGVDPLLHALGPLMCFPGVFVPGSNCYFAPRPRKPWAYLGKHRDPSRTLRHRQQDTLDWRRMHEAFGRAGWRDASNRALSLAVGGLRVDISGVDDPHIRRDRFAGWPAGSSTSPDAPQLRLGLTHAPYRGVLDAFAATGAELVLAGHTHGGQLRVPRYGALVSNCDLPTGRAAGLGWWASAGRRVPLNVSAGLGSSRMVPFRVACRPEAVLLTLTARPEG